MPDRGPVVALPEADPPEHRFGGGSLGSMAAGALAEPGYRIGEMPAVAGDLGVELVAGEGGGSRLIQGLVGEEPGAGQISRALSRQGLAQRIISVANSGGGVGRRWVRGKRRLGVRLEGDGP